ncbi:MAG: hypothetical protein JSC189_000755 [Candidatus Tokpelaia sp. JSC189]|nr:MAG: hypothetical protein JSC189_000755 [Candidatus Tokpelaia sp. JSC189]
MEDEDMMIDDGSGKPERDIPKVFDASCKGSRFLARESFDRITPMEMIHHALVSGALPETFERWPMR